MTDQIFSLREISDRLDAASLDDDVLMFEKFHGEIADNNPRRLDALIIMLVDAGEAEVGIDLSDYHLTPGSLLITQTKNVIHAFKSSPDFHGRIVACSRQALESLLPKLSDLPPLLLNQRTDPVIQLPEEKIREVLELYRMLETKLNSDTRFRRQKVLSILSCLMLEILDANHVDSDDVLPKRSRKEEIMARFILAVGEHFRTERSVNAYADMLGITAKHLSAVVKEISGKTAGQWIENYIILEAKIMLRTTDLSIQQIADKLTFPNQSSFGKYFKNLEGISPSTYRKHLS